MKIMLSKYALSKPIRCTASCDLLNGIEPISILVQQRLKCYDTLIWWAPDTVQRLLINKCETDCATGAIDLFTDTAAILNLLDLRSIMGCPGGTRSVFTRAFRAKRELHCIFLGKKAIIITFKDGATIIFLITIFLKENLKKNLPEKHA